jgi:Tat protein translocase TatC
VFWTLRRHDGWHEPSTTVSAVQTLEVVDADGVGALGDCSTQWRGNIPRMVYGAVPVVLSQWRSLTHIEETNHLFNPWGTRRVSLVLVLCGPHFQFNAATYSSVTTSPRDRGGLVYLSPTEPFNLYLDVALVGGLFVASPFVFHQLWLFIARGLYRKERRYVLPFLVGTVGLFIAGGIFEYKAVSPESLDFLVSYGQRFRPMITIGEYTKLFATITVGPGLIFEMPIFVFFLV